MTEPNTGRSIGLCVLCGLPGAGKSTLAAALREQQSPYTILVVSYDDIIGEEAFQAKSRELSCLSEKPGGRESQWKQYRQHVLQCLEHLLSALTTGSSLPAPSKNIRGTWERFCQSLERQGLITTSTTDSHQCVTNSLRGPLYFILDDNFYYQSMRYEVCQLARRYSLAFCQLYLHCAAESCLRRNRSRQEQVSDETILLMERRIEKPNPEKNVWEQNSLLLDGSGSNPADGAAIFSLMNQALKNPLKPLEDDTKEKARDREICAANLIHQADQTLRRLISETMKALQGSVSAQDVKRIALDLQCVKSRAMDQFRQHIAQKSFPADDGQQGFSVHSFFTGEKEQILRPYLCHAEKA